MRESTAEVAKGHGILLGWTDSHCHLHDLEGIEDLLVRARKAEVEKLICVGTNEDSSRAAIELVRSSGAPDLSRPDMWATIGQHPHDASQGSSWIEDLLSRNMVTPAGVSKPRGSVVAVGECGLDYFYDYSPREAQQEAFIAQIELARRYDLALVVHTRDAWEDTFAILEAEQRPDRVVIHCFTGGPDEARRCLDIGAYLSFSGIATFKNAEEIRLAVDLCPLDRLLIETDSPYLAPVPHRGAPNEPAFVTFVGRALAERKHLPEGDFAALTTQNAIEVFGLGR